MKNGISSIKERLKRLISHKESIDLELYGLHINLIRKSSIDTPNEITIVLPRVELRKECINGDCSKYENEIILNSITIVSAPRHPLAAPSNNKE